MIRKYIRSIRIVFDKDYKIVIEYHLDIPDEEYIVDIRYNVAVENKAKIAIFLSEKYQLKYGMEAEVSKLNYIKLPEVMLDLFRSSIDFDRSVINEAFKRGDIGVNLLNDNDLGDNWKDLIGKR